MGLPFDFFVVDITPFCYRNKNIQINEKLPMIPLQPQLFTCPLTPIPIRVPCLLGSTPLFLVNSAQVGPEVGGNSEGTSISPYLGLLLNGTWTHIGTGPQAHREGGGLVLGPSCDDNGVLNLSSSEVFSPLLAVSSVAPDPS